MRRGFSLAICLFAILILTTAPRVWAQGDFYKGKTITVYVGTTPGALYDQWSRLLAQYMGKHIPGNPVMIVQNMPGAGHMIAANYLYNRTKPDGLSLIGSIVPSLYFDQLVGRKEAQYDWAKFVWIGSPVLGEYQMYMRADTPYKTIEDVRNAKEPPRCGAQGTSDTAYYLPKLFEETIGTKFNLVQGYPGGPEIDLAVERGEIHCRAFTIEAFLSREPYHTWRKKGFARILMQTGQTRDPRLADVPTLRDLMDEHKTPESERRLVPMVLAATDFGRPIVAPPGIPADRMRILRAAFLKTMNDPDLLTEAKRKNLDITPSTGEELEALAKQVMAQTPDVVARVKTLMDQ